MPEPRVRALGVADRHDPELGEALRSAIGILHGGEPLAVARMHIKIEHCGCLFSALRDFIGQRTYRIDEPVAVPALRALYAIGPTQREFFELVRVIESTRAEVRFWGACCLAKLGPPSIEALAPLMEADAEIEVAVLTEWSRIWRTMSPALEWIANRLGRDDIDPKRMVACLDLLRLLRPGTDWERPLILSLLDADDPETRFAAAAVLGWNGDASERLTEVFLAGLMDAETHFAAVRHFEASSLAPRELLRPLIELWRDPNDDLAFQVTMALTSYDVAVVREELQRLESDSGLFRERAEEWLKNNPIEST